MPGIEYLKTLNGSLAYHHTPGDNPAILFCGGFASDMMSTKALALEEWALSKGVAFTRFDYRGHGSSSGLLTEGSIGDWYQDSVSIIDHVTSGAEIIVGSSMGGWIMILTALARPSRIAGLIGIASAPDFTEELIWKNLDQTSRQHLLDEGILPQSSSEDSQDHGSLPITLHLIEEARPHLILGSSIDVRCPVRLIHGMEDDDVPWQMSMTLLQRLKSPNVHLTLIKDGQHRLSRPQDLDVLTDAVDSLIAAI